MPRTARSAVTNLRSPHTPARAHRASRDAGAAYLLHGRRVWSEVALPSPRLRDGAVPAAEQAERAEIALRLGRGAAPVPPEGSLRAWMPCPVHGEDQRVYRAGGETWIWQRAVATVHMRAGADRAVVYPEPGADASALGHFLLQPVLVHLLNLRRAPCLHAGAVALGGGAVALLGASGQGKSTLTAGFVRRGAALLCDDALVLERRAGQVCGVPGPAHLKIWPETVPALLPDAAETAALSPACAKRVVALPASGRRAGEPLPLRAALVLARYDAAALGRTDVALMDLAPGAQLAALAAHTIGRDYLLPAEEAALLPHYAALAGQARVRVVHYPSGLEHLDAVVEAIRAFVEAA